MSCHENGVSHLEVRMHMQVLVVLQQYTHLGTKINVNILRSIIFPLSSYSLLDRLLCGGDLHIPLFTLSMM